MLCFGRILEKLERLEEPAKEDTKVIISQRLNNQDVKSKRKVNKMTNTEQQNPMPTPMHSLNLVSINERVANRSKTKGIDETIRMPS